MSIISSNSATVTSFIRDEMVKRGYKVYMTKRAQHGDLSYPTEFRDPWTDSPIFEQDGWYKTTVYTPEYNSHIITINSRDVLNALESHWISGLKTISPENQKNYWDLGQKAYELTKSK